MNQQRELGGFSMLSRWPSSKVSSRSCNTAEGVSIMELCILGAPEKRRGEVHHRGQELVGKRVHYGSY